MAKSPRESVIEKAVVKAILERGGVIDKTMSLTRRGYFDRIAVVDGTVWFIETKRPKGGVISPHQSAVHEAYRAAGANVVTIRNQQQLDALCLQIDGEATKK